MNRRNFLAAAATGAAAVSLTSPAKVLGANDRVRVGIIGAGSRGQEDMHAVIGVPGVEFVAIADVYSRNRDQAKAIASGAQTYDDPRRLLDRHDIDAVIVATPLFLHSKYFHDTLDSGKDLYCEKTMTWNIAEAIACRKAAETSKQIIQIGLQHESGGEHTDARRWVKQGLPGKVALVESWMSRNSPHGHGQWVRPIPPDCDPQHVGWDLFLNDRPKEAFNGNRFVNWRLFWEFSGGNITENMVHQIAWIMTVLDLKEPLAATMSGGVFSEKDGRQVPDTIAVTLEFPDLTVVWQSTFSNSHFGLGERILGSDGTIEHLSGSTDMISGKSTSGITFYPEKINNPSGRPLTGQSKDVSHMQNWIDCIRSRNRQTNAPVETGYRSAVAAHMANLAYREKRRITWEEAREFKQPY
ncbi:Gfo/Idh/MocA family protein [Acidicapsa ligni]|uniref:Gfo/Idh/MocA family protein n=1 Tax=Acidicapsa ligni TaxID=542300 RepID=UPI0021E004E4|nr:Gfo/Idh/MocA family oxidoreductase [Acidicapsa ligni]